MGNSPSEANMGDSLQCAWCHTELPPCTSFSDVYKSTIENITVHVFNGGEYVRQMNHPDYFCVDCFYEKVSEEKKKTREPQSETMAVPFRPQYEEIGSAPRYEAEQWYKKSYKAGQPAPHYKVEQCYETSYAEQQPASLPKVLHSQEEQARRRYLMCYEEEHRPRPEPCYRLVRKEIHYKKEQPRNRVLEFHETHCLTGIEHRTEQESEQEQQQLSRKSVQLVREHFVLKQRLNEFSPDEPGKLSDELLEVLSSQCDSSVTSLSLSQLTDEQLGQIMSALDSLLFEKWTNAHPSLRTLQHAQVFLTQLCILTLETSEEASLQSVSSHVQSLVQTISQSADDIFENLLLTQALYLTLVHFFTEDDHSDAVHIAKRWAEGNLSAETLFVLNLLCTLTKSLDNVVGMASVFVLKMEIQCLRLLFSTLTHLNGKEAHKEVTEMHLSLVQRNRWQPAEVLILLKAFSKRNAEDASITKILTLIQVYDVSPAWTDDSQRSIIEAIDLSDPEDFYTMFLQALRNQGSDLPERVALSMHRNFDELVLKRVRDITNITLDTLQHSQNDPEGANVLKRDYKIECMDDGDIQEILTQLCKAVFHTKGWWPSQSQMMHWCAVVLTEKSQPLKLVGFEEDPCVTAMIAAVQICTGNKLDIVLSSGALSEQEIKESSDFYKHLGISLDTNRRSSESEEDCDVYEADIVYGAIEDFVADYFQYSSDVMEAGCPQRIRGFIIEKGCLSAGQNLNFSRLKDNEAHRVVAEELQSLMGKISSEEMEARHSFVLEIFNVLHADLKDNEDMKVMTLLQTLTGQKLPSGDVFVLTFLESLLKAFDKKVETKKNCNLSVVKWCFESLLACAMQTETSGTSKELLHMVLNLVTQSLWSPNEALKLLGTLTAHHHDGSFISILKILQLMTTYQISSEWKDENNQSLLQLTDSSGTQDLILRVQNSCEAEKEKSIDTLFDEIRAMEALDEETLEKSYTVVKHVQDLIKTGEIKNHIDVQGARSLSHSMETEDLQEVLAVLCNAVHNTIAGGWWWPRGTQMASWCFLALADNGKLLQMGTGEGKSAVIAMFAALRALRGEKIDVISSSPVLSQRDAKECARFYRYFGLTVDTNTNKTRDTDRKKCYEKDIVYGTVETYAADHLRQTFEMKDVRPDRRFECIIIDEVDLLLLDQGIQMTYLSSPMVSMHHLNIILTMIWNLACQYGFLSTEYQTFVRGPPASFYKVIFDSMDTEGTEINDPMNILQIAEEWNIVKKGFTEEIYKSDKDAILAKLKDVSQDDQIKFFQKIEDYVRYGFTVYTVDDKGSLSLRNYGQNKQVIQNLKFLVLDDGLCCPLYDSEEIVIGPIAELISDQLQYTPCENNKKKINIPGFLKGLVEHKLPTWVRNAFLAMKLTRGQEYVVEDEHIYPVDFKSTGIVELNRKWGDGLQQFLEIKHQIKISTISSVTNYVSNGSFFEKYNGKIYGLTGTLGSKSDLMFLNEQYPGISACKIPTFNRKKLFEVQGILKTSTEEWKSEVKRVLLDQISPNSYKQGRAALVICETINKVNDLYEELKDSIPGKIIQYSRSDKDVGALDMELNPGDVVLATNLAGRGTNIKITDEVNENGGLFVILSFLSDSERVEYQAFGRTARKGNPGSAQLIISTQHLQECYRTVSSLEEAKNMRDSIAAETILDMQKDIDEMKLREDLFSEYCKTLQEIYKNTDEDEKKAIVSIINEFWGIWLQTKSEEIHQVKRRELEKSLRADLAFAKKQSESQNSPSSSIYHYVKFGNIALREKKWDVGTRLYQKATKEDASWAAIAFYNRSYCIIQQKSGDYLTQALDELKRAQDSLKYFSEECLVGLSFIKMSSLKSAKGEKSSLETQFTTKCNMLSYLDKNMGDAIKKLEEIKGKKRDALAEKASVFTMVSDTDEELQMEIYNLYDRGLEYIFAVEEKPRFPWGAVGVFCIGVAQIVGGVLLTVFTYGTLASVGMGLISEGISDCISGIKSMITGEFSWQSWAIDKAISVGLTLLGAGIGQLVSHGFKAAKYPLQGTLKGLPKLPAGLTKEGFSVVMTTNMKTALLFTAKTMVEKTVLYGIGKIEDAIISEILKVIRNKVEEGIREEVKCNMEKDPGLINSIILSHVENKQDLNELMVDGDMKRNVLARFTELSTATLRPFAADLSWQNQISASIMEVMDAVQEHQTDQSAKVILEVIKSVYLIGLATHALHIVVSLSETFFSSMRKGMQAFRNKEVNTSDLSSSDKVLKEIRQDVAASVSTLLADTLVDVFHQKFSSHLVSKMKGEVNGVIGNHIDSVFERTKEKLVEQAGPYIKQVGGQQSKLHAEMVRKAGNIGSMVDAKVLSAVTGAVVVILTKGKDGMLTKMQEMNTSTEDASQTVTLVYTPKSSEHPDGHYDVRINDQTVSVEKGDVYHAMAKGLNPGASKKKIAEAAFDLRSEEAEALEKKPNQWESSIQCEQWTEELITGSKFIAGGVASSQDHVTTKEKVMNILRQESEKAILNKKWLSHGKDIEITGTIINGENCPSKNSILIAGHFNTGSKLSQAMFEVATDSSDHAKCKLPVVYVPHELHNQFPTAGSPELKKLLAQTISMDDVEGTFKLTILGAMPTFIPKQKYFQNKKMSLTRLDSFKATFPKHATEMVKAWFRLLESKTDLITPDTMQRLEDWISNKGYLDPNDPFRKQITSYI